MNASPLQRRVRVLVADDHPIIKLGIETLVQQEPQLQLVGSAASFTELRQTLAARETIDVLVLDLNGMGSAPLVMVRDLRKRYSNLRMVVFSAATDMIPEILAAGVHGYVVKDELVAHIVTAIWAAWRGQQYLSPIASEYLERSAWVEAPRCKLAPNERQVLHLLAQGLGTAEIAAEMGIDPRTVQNYIGGLRRKTGCTERTQLATWYRQLTAQEPPLSVG